MKNPHYYNSEGYADPTAYYGTKDIMKEDAELERKVHQLVSTIKDVANLAGFDISNRIVLKDRKSGKEFR